MSANVRMDVRCDSAWTSARSRTVPGVAPYPTRPDPYNPSPNLTCNQTSDVPNRAGVGFANTYTPAKRKEAPAQ